ncbi:MAG: hypothetical protein ACKV1O_12705 [Saprospiraceae bacterium]
MADVFEHDNVLRPHTHKVFYGNGRWVFANRMEYDAEDRLITKWVGGMPMEDDRFLQEVNYAYWYWAIKRLLRQKANYDILEGFLTVLLGRHIKIMNIPESEGNPEGADDKIINIVYFDLGQGNDYVYHGTTDFKGIHTNDTLQVNVRQKELFGITTAYQIYPEYYIIRVNKFNDVAKDSLDEWIYYLKNNRLPEAYSAPGLDKVAEILNYDNMNASAKAQYEAHQYNETLAYDLRGNITALQCTGYYSSTCNYG